jgi:hypothetical protein
MDKIKYKSNRIDLKQELLGSYIETDSTVNSNAQNIIKSENPGYELGRFCAANIETPLDLFNDRKMKDIRKKVFGEECRAVGEAWSEKYDGDLVQLMMEGKKAPTEVQAELVADITNTCLNFGAEFYKGFCDNTSKKAYEQMTKMFSRNVKMIGSFWEVFGFKMPDTTDYAGEFMYLVKKRDLAGLVEMYHEHPAEINKTYKDAKEFMAFVESKIKK